jgi:hypothetical protein
VKQRSLCLLGVFLLHSSALSQPSSSQPPLTLNRTNRSDVVNFFQTVYRASEGVPIGWNGDRASCNAGTNSQAYVDATVLRVNFFRAMAGVPADVISSNIWNLKCQDAALMMLRQGELSHTPTANWLCYTADGAEAAGRSLIGLYEGPSAVDAYMDDFGFGNATVAHRRRILFPPQKIIGTGTIPAIGGFPCNALWTGGGAGVRPAQPEWVAWPPPGYVPWQILPPLSERWSFTYSGEATFADATVTMKSSGTNVPVFVEYRERVYGRDMGIIWNPINLPKGAPRLDTTYTVTISNVLVDLTYESFTYDVTIIDPVPVNATFAPRGTWPGQARNYQAAHLEISGNYAYVADGIGGLRVIDVSDPFRPTLVGGFATGDYASDIYLTKQYAYLSDRRGGLRVADVSNPALPSLVGSYDTTGSAEAIVVDGNYAYVADGSAGVQVVDISDPARIVRVGGYVPTGFCRDITLAGNYGYLVSDDGVLEILDLTDPANPSPKGQCLIGGTPQSIQVVGNYAFIAAGSAGLQIVNVSEPTNPQRAGNFTPSGSIRSVRVVDGYAYVTGSGGVRVLDISDPSKPLLINSYPATSTSASSFQIAGNYAYFLDGEWGMRVLELKLGLPQTLEWSFPNEIIITNSPVRLEVLASSKLPVSFSVITGPATVSGNELTLNATGDATIRAEQAGNERFLPVTIDRSFKIIPASQEIIWMGPATEALRLATRYPLAAQASSGLPVSFRVQTGPAMIEGTNLIVNAPGSVRITAEQIGNSIYSPVSLSRSFNIPHVIFTERGNWLGESGEATYGVQIVERHAYLAAGAAGLIVLDLSDPAALRVVGRCSTKGSAVNVAVLGNHAYIADSSGLQVIDVSDPAAPVRIGEHPTTTPAFAVRLRDNVAYLACGDSGLQSIDVSVPTNPVVLGSYDTTGRALDLWIADQIVYVADSEAGLQMFDAKDPANLRRLGSHAVSGSARVIQTRGNLAFIGADAELRVIDISNPATPHNVGSYRAGSLIRSIGIMDNFIYLANEGGALEVIDISEPAFPVKVDGYQMGGIAVDIQVVGTLAYLARADQGVRVLEVRTGVPQLLAVDVPSKAILADSPLTLTAKASSGLPVRYSVVSGEAKVNGDQLTLSAPGEVTIRAEQAGDEQFLPIKEEYSVNVSMFAPPRFELRSVAFSLDNKIRLQVHAAPTQELVLEFSTDFKSWTVVATATASGASVEFTASSPLVFKRGFYRVRVL